VSDYTLLVHGNEREKEQSKDRVVVMEEYVTLRGTRLGNAQDLRECWNPGTLPTPDHCYGLSNDGQWAKIHHQPPREACGASTAPHRHFQCCVKVELGMLVFEVLP
jgi:hypothetical protein